MEMMAIEGLRALTGRPEFEVVSIQTNSAVR